MITSLSINRAGCSCAGIPVNKPRFALLPFQNSAIPKGLNILQRGHGAVLIAPTGTGKNYYIAEIIGLLRELRTQQPHKYPVALR